MTEPSDLVEPVALAQERVDALLDVAQALSELYGEDIGSAFVELAQAIQARITVAEKT